MTDIQPYEQTSDEGLDLLIKQAKAMDATHQLTTVLTNTQMVPQQYRGKPDDATAAILYGAEVGLKPQQALQQVFVVHGQPAIYARTMVGLLKAKGYRFEAVASTDDYVTVRGESPRGEVEESTWTLDRAKKAGYTSNKKYQSDPQAMLYAKAASEVCRKLAPDVLLGIRYTAEDLELEQQPVRMTAKRKPQAKSLQAALESKPQPEEPVEDPLSQVLADIEAADSRATLGEIMQAAQSTLDDDEYETARQVANAKHGELDG